NRAGLRNPYGSGPNGNPFLASSAAHARDLPGDHVLEWDCTTGAPVGSGDFFPQGSAWLNEPDFLPLESTVPEPSTLILGCAGGVCLLAYGWRRQFTMRARLVIRQSPVAATARRGDRTRRRCRRDRTDTRPRVARRLDRL